MRKQFVVGMCLSLVVASVAAKDRLCHDQKNDMEVSECMSAEAEKADKKLAKYLDAATARIASDPSIRLSLDDAQKAWLHYRSLQCGDVYKYWLDGTYRYRAAFQCQIDLTQERTHDLWSAYLTYVDSTPPVLPEP